jgi:D-amino-acid dehydrogenase
VLSGLAKAHAALFHAQGPVVGGAATLEQCAGSWRVAGSSGTVVAREAVVALGPWSDLVFRLRRSKPFAAERFG